jgi:hypothetical protein
VTQCPCGTYRTIVSRREPGEITILDADAYAATFTEDSVLDHGAGKLQGREATGTAYDWPHHARLALGA